MSCIRSDNDRQYVIGILSPNPAHELILNGFKSKMAEHGYIEGKNITYIKVNDASVFDEALGDFKEKNVDLVLTATTPAAVKARDAMKRTDIPVAADRFSGL